MSSSLAGADIPSHIATTPLTRLFITFTGLNVGGGQRICLRLRHAGDRNQFLPVEQVTDTMLHELAHNVHGPHDAKFHALWNQLRDEHEALVMKGYTGEGFLSDGHRLGGRGMPREEAQRLARVAAEKRRALHAGSGQRLGGAPIRPGQDVRRVIADAAERRNRTLRGCANDNKTQDEIVEIADTATRNGFRTRAEEDAANEAAIAQALWELVQEDEKAKQGDAYVPPTAGNPAGSAGGGGVVVSGHEWSGPTAPAQRPPYVVVDDENEDMVSGQNIPTTWTCEICTLVNPLSYLCCDACGVARGERVSRDLARQKPSSSPSSSKRQRTTIDLTESPGTQRQQPRTRTGTGTVPPPAATTAAPKTAPQTWQCSFCGRVREKQWWTCDLCGKSKHASTWPPQPRYPVFAGLTVGPCLQ